MVVTPWLLLLLRCSCLCFCRCIFSSILRYSREKCICDSRKKNQKRLTTGEKVKSHGRWFVEPSLSVIVFFSLYLAILAYRREKYWVVPSKHLWSTQLLHCSTIIMCDMKKKKNCMSFSFLVFSYFGIILIVSRRKL